MSRSNVFLLLFLISAGWFLTGCGTRSRSFADGSYQLRIATINIEDLRTEDLLNRNHPRLKRAVALIQELRPDLILINEITYDQDGTPGYVSGEPEGMNGQRFADGFLNVSQGQGLQPIRYQVYMAPVNTGLASGFDLDNDGRAVSEIPVVPPSNPDGTPGPQTDAGRAYGNDAWGFGMFPGQYGMALLVRNGLEILHDSVRTFRLFKWSSMPGALEPVDPSTGKPWYSAEEWASFRLSSKSHWDVPVRLPSGEVLHMLASHPTPPAFDGPERRNQYRNADEIRFWGDYLSGADYIVSDSGQVGGLQPDAHFVLLGDMNADPDEGNTYENPIGKWLLNHPRVNGSFVPLPDSSAIARPELSDDDTAEWGMRVDYVLPSVSLEVLGGGIRRPTAADTAFVQVSDHFPVWLDVVVPARDTNQ